MTITYVTRPVTKKSLVPKPTSIFAPKSPTTVLAPDDVAVPPPPTSDDAHIYDEQQVARAEILMLKGVRLKHHLMAMLGVADQRTMLKYIERVHARWELVGSERDFTRYRGEGLRRLDQMEREVWKSIEPAQGYVDSRVQQVAFRNLLEINNQRLTLLGVTAKKVEEILNARISDGSGVDTRIAQHDKLAVVAMKIVETMAKKMGVTVEQIVDHYTQRDLPADGEPVVRREYTR